MRKFACLLVLWFCGIVVAHAQQSVLEVIDLRYRSAQEMLPLLQSFIVKDGSISALDNRLVVHDLLVDNFLQTLAVLRDAELLR